MGEKGEKLMMKWKTKTKSKYYHHYHSSSLTFDLSSVRWHGSVVGPLATKPEGILPKIIS